MKDDFWIDKTFDKLRSRSANGSDHFSDVLEEKMMTEFTRAPQRKRSRFALTIAMAGLLGIGTVGGVAVGAYQDTLRAWWYGPWQVDANGNVRNEAGKVVGEMTPTGEGSMVLELEEGSFVFEATGEEKLPTAPFTITVDAEEHQTTNGGSRSLPNAKNEKSASKKE